MSYVCLGASAERGAPPSDYSPFTNAIDGSDRSIAVGLAPVSTPLFKEQTRLDLLWQSHVDTFLSTMISDVSIHVKIQAK